MPPKPRFTREEIVDAALDIVSRKGIEALTARELGEALGSSARPIFTVFRSMEELQQEVRSAAMRRFKSYAGRTMPGVPLVQAGGHADGSLRRAGAEALSSALHARKPQRRQL